MQHKWNNVRLVGFRGIAGIQPAVKYGVPGIGHMDYYFSAWNPYNPNQDLDGDNLKDSDEPNLRGLLGVPYNPNSRDTNADFYDDDEDLACTYEDDWEMHSADEEDWANPGHQKRVN